MPAHSALGSSLMASEGRIVPKSNHSHSKFGIYAVNNSSFWTLPKRRSERIKSGALLLAGAPSVFKEKSIKISLVPRVHVALSSGTGPIPVAD